MGRRGHDASFPYRWKLFLRTARTKPAGKAASNRRETTGKQAGKLPGNFCPKTFNGNYINKLNGAKNITEKIPVPRAAGLRSFDAGRAPIRGRVRLWGKGRPDRKRCRSGKEAGNDRDKTKNQRATFAKLARN
jgi:hypothetical protein